MNIIKIMNIMEIMNIIYLHYIGYPWVYACSKNKSHVIVDKVVSWLGTCSY